MPKIAFLGAGSTIFAKNILGDCMLAEALAESHFALYDIDRARLDESRMMLENLNAQIDAGRARITCHLGPEERKDALHGARYVVNAVQVGGYEPSTVIDFEVPKRHGLGQTIPAAACVEVPCMCDSGGVNPCAVGDLPEPCAAVNRTNVNV